MTAPVAAGSRLEWDEVPPHVRRGIEDVLGARVAAARTQTGGFSPGVAARVDLADGRRVFVKAVGSAVNPETPDLNRAEIVALHLMPAHLPVAQLLGSYDDGDWVALVLEDVEGRRPSLPWTCADATSVSATLRAVAGTTAPEELPAFADVVLALSAWDDVAADPTGLDPAVVARLPEMLELQARAREVTPGNALVHWDVRNDNVLIRPDGTAVLLDWAWACRGAPWLDTLLLALDFAIQGGPDPDAYLGASAVTADVDRQDLRALLACIVGVWTERARRPAPPGLPTIRAWQSRCAVAALRWLDEGALWR